MERHLKNLAIAHIIYGSLLILWSFASLALIGPLGRILERLPYHAHRLDFLHFDVYTASLWWALALAGVIFGLAAIIGGWGLYHRKNWGRMTVLVIGVLALFRIPFGTAVGIYTLWVLLKPEAARMTGR